MNDADGHGRDFGHLRGAVTPCSSDDLEAILSERTNQQGREYALGTDGRCKFFQGNFFEGAAWIGFGLTQQSECYVAVFRGIDDLRFHDGVLLSSG